MAVMVRANAKEVADVDPFFAQIAGMGYAVLTSEEIVKPKVEFFSSKLGIPDDCMTIRLKSGNRITPINTCAANIFGIVEPNLFRNIDTAKKTIQFFNWCCTSNCSGYD